MFTRNASDTPTGPYRKPRADMYTALLVITLMALLIGILCLYLEMKGYNFEFRGAPKVSLRTVEAVDGLCGSPWSVAAGPAHSVTAFGPTFCDLS